MERIRPLLDWLWTQKWRGVLVIALVPVFGLLLFPFEDLSDLVTAQVAKGTGNRVYVQFEDMGLNLFPMGMSFEKFSVETGALPPLNVDELTLSPSIMSLLTQKPAGSLRAEGILRGEASISVKPGKKTESGAPTQAVTLNAEKIQLADLRQFLNLPVMIRGSTDLSADGSVDLAFTTQPDIQFEITAGRTEITSSVLNLPLGPVVLPDLGVSQFKAKGRLSAGQLLIEEALIGKTGDELHGKLSGQFNLELRNMGGRIFPMQGSYSYKVDIWASNAFEERAKFFLALVESHKQPEGSGHRYRFTLSGDARTGQFNVTALR